MLAGLLENLIKWVESFENPSNVGKYTKESIETYLKSVSTYNALFYTYLSA